MYNFDYSKDQNPVEFQVGDIVWLIRDKSAIHGAWPRAKVTDVLRGPDGKVRTVYVQTGDQVLKKKIADLALLVREPDATTTTTEEGLVIVPQFKPNPKLYKTDKAGASLLW